MPTSQKYYAEWNEVKPWNLSAHEVWTQGRSRKYSFWQHEFVFHWFCGIIIPSTLSTLDACNFGVTRDKNAGPKTMEYLSLWLIYILICNYCIFWINGSNLKTAHSTMIFLGMSAKNTDILMFFVWIVKKGLTALGLLLTQQILLFEHFTENNFTTCG